jgi:hypothetical protein
VGAGSTPWRRHRQRERFARATEASPTTKPSTEASPPADQPNDPELAGELAIVLMLRRSADATAPDAETRARMRDAVLARWSAHPTESEEPAAEAVRPAGSTPGRRSRRSAPARPAGRADRVTGTRGRLVIALGAALCLVLALSGMTLFLSRDALPGDPLYAVRRTVESAQLGLTSGDDGKGRKHLEYAADRLGDIQTLVARNPDPADSPVGDYLTALADFDTDAKAGTADLTDYATTHGEGVLTTLRDWATEQTHRIERFAPALPTVARARAARSVTLLAGIIQRANAVQARESCYTITSGITDELGPVPVTGPCDTPPVAGVAPRPNGTRPVVGSVLRTPAVTTVTGSTGPGIDRPAGVPPAPTTTFPVPPVYPPPIAGTAPGPVTTTPPPPGLLPLPTITLPPLVPGVPPLRLGR